MTRMNIIGMITALIAILIAVRFGIQELIALWGWPVGVAIILACLAIAKRLEGRPQR